MSILPFLRRILRDDDILVLCRVFPVRLFVDQRMLEEVHVVALWEIAARVSAAALLARRCPLHDGMGDLQEIAELDVLLVPCTPILLPHLGHFPTRGPERLVGICTPYRYKFPVGARDLFSFLEAVSSIPNNLSTFPLVTCNFPNLQKRLIELFPPVK